MKILIVEDEKNISDYLRKGLSEAGYGVDAVFDGEEAVNYATALKYDLIILDIMIPKLDGIAVCTELRKRKVNSKILMVTAKDKIEDKIKGLDSGADDYLIKPFSFAELLARTRALLRRGGEVKESILEAKDLQVNLISREVYRGNNKIELTAKEFSLMEYFLRNKNHILTRTMIAEQIWEIDFITDTNVIDVYINHLRTKIDKNYKEKLIYTVRGVGYTLKG